MHFVLRTTKYINTPCGHNVEFVNVRPGGTLVTNGLKSRQSVSCLADLLGDVWPVGPAAVVASDTDLGTAITLLFLLASQDQRERLGLAN